MSESNDPKKPEEGAKKDAQKASSPLSAESVPLPSGSDPKDREGRATMVGLPANLMDEDKADVRRDDEGIEELVVDHGGVAGSGDLDDLADGDSTAALGALPQLENAWLVEDASGDAREIGDELVIGREEPATWVMNLPTVSKKHFRVYRDNNRYFLQDLKATNGTYLNNRAVKGSAVQLRADDQIIAAVTLKNPTGACSFTFKDQDPSAS